MNVARELCTSHEGLHWSINALHAHLNTYDVEVWSILCEQDTCAASVQQLEEALMEEESMDEEAELAQEKVHYNTKRGMVVCQEVVVEGDDEGEDEGEGRSGSELEEDDNELVHWFGMSVKAKGKCPAK